jgi:Tfp pilus assembly protein PilF
MINKFKQISSIKKIVILVIFFFITGFIIYLPALSGPFVFDDINILENDAITKALNIRTLYFSAPARFLPFTTFAIQYLYIKDSPFGYHLFNIIFHVLNSIIVFIFVRSLISTTRNNFQKRVSRIRFIPLITSVLFLAHPIQTQAVSYISQRYTVVVSFFYLTCLFFYVLFRKETEHYRKTNRKYVYYFFSLFFSTCAFFSKENSYTLPFVILILDFVFFNQTAGNFMKKCLFSVPFFILVISVNFFRSPLITSTGVHLTIPSAAQGYSISRSKYLLTQINVVPKYIRLLIVPIGQNLDYDYSLSNSFFEFPTLISFSFLLALVVIALKKRKTNSLFMFGIFFFFITLSIESSIFPIADVIFEHRIYLPFVGFFLAVSSIIFYFPQKISKVSMSNLYYPAFTGLIIVLSFLTYNRNILWGNDILLWKDTVAKSPNKARPHFNLGLSYEKHIDYKNAVEEFKKTILIDPQHYDAYNHLTVSYESMGQLDNAEKYGLMSIYKLPLSPILHENLAIIYLKKGDLNQALVEFHRALSLDPGLYKTYLGIGIVYSLKGDYENAVKNFQKALEINGLYIQAHLNLAATYEKMNRLDLAKGEYEKILIKDPGNIMVSDRFNRLK